MKILKEYSFFFAPAVLCVAIININWYYRYYFDFDIAPYLNLSEVLVMSFYSLGSFSAGVYIMILIPILSTILFYAAQHTVLEHLGELAIGHVMSKNLTPWLKGGQRSFHENQAKVRRQRDEMLNTLEPEDPEVEIKRNRINEIFDRHEESAKESAARVDSAMKEYNELMSKQHEQVEKLKSGDFSELISLDKLSFVIIPFNVLLIIITFVVSRPLIMFIYTKVIDYRGDLIYSQTEFLLYFFVINVILAVIFRKYLIDSNVKVSTQKILMSMIFALLLANQTTNTLREGILVKHNLKFKGTEITLDSKTIISSDSITYIGRTKDYLFLYNFFKKSTLVVPTSNIKSQTYKLNDNRDD